MMETSRHQLHHHFAKGEGFEATIKKVPKDFVVDECSSFVGEIRSIPSCSDVTKRPLKREAEPLEESDVKRHRTSIVVGCCSHGALEEGNMIDVNWCQKNLIQILPKEAFFDLNTFAEQVKTELDDPVSKIVDPLLLGSFENLEQRTTVHRCVRFLFPYLKTVTIPHSGSVKVQKCPNYSKFMNVIGHEQTDQVFRFIHVEAFENLRNEILIDGHYAKDARRKIHHLISSCFGKFMETKTLPSSKGEDHRIISIRRKPQRSKHGPSQNTDSKTITAFTLWKKNCETYSAIHHLGRHLSIPHNLFNIAGIKDKRAITTQTCTVQGVSAAIFSDACKSLPKFLKVCNCRNVSRSIRLGELDGNQFCIKLTEVRGVTQDQNLSREDIRSAIEDVKTTGFINYFGSQRFGRKISQTAPSSPNLEAPAIGLAMLQGDFETAISILLTPTEGADSGSSADNISKGIFQATKNVEETLNSMPAYKLRELSVLRTLKRYGCVDGETCSKALLGLSYSARLLYVHSFCSYLWNLIATERICKLGDQVAKGDFVRVRDACEELPLSKQVTVVTETDIAQGNFTLKDVVLPIPGSQVRYPPCMREEYLHIMQTYGIRENHTFRIPSLKLHAPGAYRKLIEFPKELSLQFLPRKGSSECNRDSQDNSESESDMRVKNNSQTFEDCDVKRSELRNQLTDDEQKEEIDEKRLHCEGFDLELKFQLPPSCYATTFLSEVTKGHLR